MLLPSRTLVMTMTSEGRSLGPCQAGGRARP